MKKLLYLATFILINNYVSATIFMSRSQSRSLAQKQEQTTNQNALTAIGGSTPTTLANYVASINQNILQLGTLLNSPTASSANTKQLYKTISNNMQTAVSAIQALYPAIESYFYSLQQVTTQNNTISSGSINSLSNLYTIVQQLSSTISMLPTQPSSSQLNNVAQLFITASQTLKSIKAIL